MDVLEPTRIVAETTLPVADIRVGERIRRDLGDIESLAQTIAVVGLLQPIGVSPDGMVKFGARRLEAVKRLGWKRIAVVICP